MRQIGAASREAAAVGAPISPFLVFLSPPPARHTWRQSPEETGDGSLIPERGGATEGFGPSARQTCRAAAAGVVSGVVPPR